MRVYCVFGVPWWPRGQPRDHTAPRVHIPHTPHSAGTQARATPRHDKTDAAPPQTHSDGGRWVWVCAYTINYDPRPTTPRNTPRRAKRARERKCKQRPPPLGQARRRAALRDRRPRRYERQKERMTNNEKRTTRRTHTYEALLDGGGQSRQTAWASAPRRRWQWRSSSQSGEQASKRAKRRHANWRPVENITKTTDRRVRT